MGVDTNIVGPSVVDLIPLISGPNRIETLKELVLDSFENELGERGRRADIGDQVKGESEGYGIREDGWHWYDDEVIGDLDDLFEAAKENGVDVRGSVNTYLENYNALKLEEANRLILRVYQTKSWDEYCRVDDNSFDD